MFRMPAQTTLILSSIALVFFGASSNGKFLIASDMSYLPKLDCYGKCSPFREEASKPTEDALKILARFGFNTIRVRLWVNPSANTPQGWPTPDYSYSNLTSVLALARRVRAAGLDLWLDFHYSDVWADPGHQTKPAAWLDLSMVDLQVAVYNHTLGALTALADQGTPAAVVQVGNEISNGMLWAPRGQPCNAGGALNFPACKGNWPTLALLVNAGIRAVRSVAPGALLMIHTDLGNGLNSSSGVPHIISWYQSLLDAGVTDWDAIGLSFYPNWGAGASSDISKLGAVATAFPEKQIVLAETAYAYRGSASGEFPQTPAGQLDYIQAVLRQARALARGGGVAYWGAEYYSYASGAGWTGLWDQQAVALPALLQGWRTAGDPRPVHPPRPGHKRHAHHNRSTEHAARGETLEI